MQMMVEALMRAGATQDEARMLGICRGVEWGNLEIEKQGGKITVVRETRTHKLK